MAVIKENKLLNDDCFSSNSTCRRTRSRASFWLLAVIRATPGLFSGLWICLFVPPLGIGSDPYTFRVLLHVWLISHEPLWFHTRNKKSVFMCMSVWECVCVLFCVCVSVCAPYVWVFVGVIAPGLSASEVQGEKRRLSTNLSRFLFCGAPACCGWRGN